MEPGTRRLLIIAGVLAGGLVTVFAASSLMHHRGTGEIPVVQADSRPIRVKPDNPGGLQVANAGNEIFSGGSDTDSSKLAPAPEVPDPAALRAPPPPPAQAAPAAPLALAPPAPPVIAEPPRPAKPTKVATETPPQPPAPARSQVAVVTPPPAAASGKGVFVQLAALTTEDAARAEWQRFAKRMPDLLGGHAPNFSRIERDGHTFWRVRTGGFADVARARSFCEQVRAKGGGCSVAEF
jgi:hypothetical protein